MTKSEMNARQQEIAQKLRKQYPRDERTAAVNEKALALCGALALLYYITRLIISGVHGELALAELIMLLISVLLMGAVKRSGNVSELPRVLGKTLDPASDAKWKRIGMYALEAAFYAGTWTVCDLVLKVAEWHWWNDLAVCFIVFFLMDFAIYELAVKRYNRSMAALDADEDNLD